MFVLVADSQSVFQQMLDKILAQQGVDYHICGSGADALEVMAVRDVDLYVLAMNLADIPTTDLCRLIRQRKGNDAVPIIILATDDTEQRFSDVFKAGASDVFKRKNIQYFSDYLDNLARVLQPINARVLLIEDSRSQRQHLQHSLEGWGLTVDAFASAEQGFAAHLREPYDIILTDIELANNENGLDFIHDLREQPIGVGDVPVIAITAFLSDSTRVNYLTRGIDRCMQKPLLMPELRSEIRKQVDAHQVRVALEAARQIEAEKNQAKTDFVARMSHEIRTSLNAIIGFSELLLLTGDGGIESVNAETIDYAGKINSAGRLLLDVINEVLDLSKIESGNIKIHMATENLADILERCHQVMLRSAKDKQIALTVLPPQINTFVYCDATRLTEVLLNLISNAIKYNHPGGSVQVSTEQLDEQRVRISVKDDGLGFSEAHAAKIFEPFVRLHAEEHDAPGTGIGLSIALQLTDLMNGEFGFNSVEGQGSHFWVDMALSKGMELSKQVLRDEFITELLPCRVLYVDDNPVNCMLLEKWFSKQPQADVAIVSNARDALRVMKMDPPDILLTDIQMPGEDGYWLLEQVRRHHTLCSLPVIALSAKAMDDEVEQGELSEFSAYLTKPFDFQLLVRTLNAVIEKPLGFPILTSTSKPLN